MTLIAEVMARPSNQRLVELSNPDTTAPSTIDMGRLQAACDDSQGWFLTHTGMGYKAAEDLRLSPNEAVRDAGRAGVAVAVSAVMATLYGYRGLPGSDQEGTSWSSASAKAKAFALQVGSLRWLPPATDSNLTPSASPAVPPATDPVRIGPFLPQIEAGVGLTPGAAFPL